MSHGRSMNREIKSKFSLEVQRCLEEMVRDHRLDVVRGVVG